MKKMLLFAVLLISGLVFATEVAQVNGPKSASAFAETLNRHLEKQE